MALFLSLSLVSGQPMTGPRNPGNLTEKIPNSVSNAECQDLDRVINFGKTLLGKPYRYRTTSGNILDCSGYISYIFSQVDLNLPKSSGQLAAKVLKISKDKIQKGDLLFFKGRKGNQVGHVSMVIEVEGKRITMMHSCRRGILIECYNDNIYYTSRFLFAGRLPVTPCSAEQAQPSSASITETVVCAGPSMDSTTTDTIRIIGVGDIMLGTNYPNKSYLPPEDGKDILLPVKPYISKADVAFGNLEGGFLTGEGTVKKCSNPDICYAFKMPDHYVNYLTDAGFDVVSIANNHVRDFGTEGTTNTIKVLNEAGLSYAGLEAYPFTVFEKNGITYGFAAFAPNTGTVKINDYDSARSIVSHLDSVCDIVIVSFHGGAEGPGYTHITRKQESFIGEDRGNPYEFARVVIDAGADIVFGHGPHVTRAIDIYKDRFIAYSLGNFATYGRFSLGFPNGFAPIVEVAVNSKGEFINGQIYSIKQPGRGGPVIDEENTALKEITKLTKSDIPECGLTINADGSILRIR
jgi:hypothetical protein